MRNFIKKAGFGSEAKKFWIFRVADPHPHPHDFGLLDPHPESAFQMQIPNADADPDEAAF
jgi:hypothetical protein